MRIDNSGSWFVYDTNWRFPQTTTRESSEQGTKLHTKFRTIGKKQLNFQSYPMNDVRLQVPKSEPPKIPPLRTSYDRDYAAPDAIICKPRLPELRSPDPLFNRRPLNDFEMLPWSKTKFMDDHIANVSDARKKVNFLRQLRNHSNVI